MARSLIWITVSSRILDAVSGCVLLRRTLLSAFFRTTETFWAIITAGRNKTFSRAPAGYLSFSELALQKSVLLPELFDAS